MAITVALTNAWETRVLEWSLTAIAANTIFTGATDASANVTAGTYHLALCTADPGETGNMVANEMNAADTTAGYLRVAITNDLDLISNVVAVTSDIAFAVASGDWSAAVTHWAICLGLSPRVDDAILYGDLTTSQTILDTDIFEFEAASHDISFVSGTMFAEHQTEVLRWLFSESSGIAAATRPTTWYRGLWTTDPTDAESGAEVVGSVGYDRVAVTYTVSGAVATPVADTDIGPATGAGFGAVAFGSVHTGATRAVTGNGLFHSASTPTKTVTAGQVLRVTASTSTITLT